MLALNPEYSEVHEYLSKFPKIPDVTELCRSSKELFDIRPPYSLLKSCGIKLPSE
jgi:hypothetical protein